MRRTPSVLFLQRLFVTLILVAGLASAAHAIVAYYPFDGTADDESGNGNHGTVFGATITQDRFGNPDSAYLFDGINDYILVSNVSAFNITGQVTLAAWISSRDISRGGQDIICKTQGGCFSLTLNEGSLSEPAGTFSFLLDVTGPYQSVSSHIKDGDDFWYHVAGVYNGTTADIYVDGNMEGTVTLSGPVATNNYMLTIGNECGQLSEPFYGSIDDVRIYDTALSSRQIAELAGVPEPGLIMAGLLPLACIFLIRRNIRNQVQRG